MLNGGGFSADSALFTAAPFLPCAPSIFLGDAGLAPSIAFPFWPLAALLLPPAARLTILFLLYSMLP